MLSVAPYFPPRGSDCVLEIALPQALLHVLPSALQTFTLQLSLKRSQLTLPQEVTWLDSLFKIHASSPCGHTMCGSKATLPKRLTVVPVSILQPVALPLQPFSQVHFAK